MQITNEGYLLTRGIQRIELKKNKVLDFIKIHKFMLMISSFFAGLVVIEGVLLNAFINLLKSL